MDENTLEQPRYRITQDDKYGFIDESGGIIIDPIYHLSGEGFIEDRCPVNLFGYWGYINEKGDPVIEPQYAYAESFSEGLAIVTDQYDRKLFTDKNGNIVIIPSSQRLYFPQPFKDGLSRVKNIHNKIGFIDKNGNIAIEPNFDIVRNFSYGYAIVIEEVGNNYKLSYIDKSGIIVSDHFEFADCFQEGYARVSKNGKFGFLNSDCKLAIDYKYDWANNFQEGISVVGYKGKVLFINSDEEIICDVMDEADFLQGKDKVGHFGYFCNGYAAIFKDQKWGFIDKNGNIAVEPFAKYFVHDFSDGLAAFHNYGVGYGFIDVHGNIILREKFPGLVSNGFISGVCGILDYQGRMLGYINKTGHYVWKNCDLLDVNEIIDERNLSAT
jgi:hypothetical protein